MQINQKKTIFLVDLSQDHVTLIKLILETQGYSVISIGNEENELNQMGQTCPDLIIWESRRTESNLDILHRLKDNYHLSQIPILLLTKSEEALPMGSVERMTTSNNLLQSSVPPTDSAELADDPYTRASCIRWSKELIGVDEICYKPFEMEDLLLKVKSLLHCKNTPTISTLILDIDEQDPLLEENKQLQSIIDREPSVWEILQQQGYEVGIS